MKALFSLYFFVLSTITALQAYAFHTSNQLVVKRSVCNRISSLYARKKTENVEEEAAFIVGENVPEEILRQKAIYDMILVERISAPEKTSFGLFLPKVEGKDQKRLGKVLSVPTSYGLESEQGRLQPINEIAPYKVGDIIYTQDPWGIGPKDQTIGQRVFSFHKAANILSVVQSS